MLIHLDRKSGEPLYAQIASYIRRLIETEVLKPGVKLPATRELAAELAVDRATIMAAYDALVGQGFATAHVGQGTFVAMQASRGERRRKVRLDPALQLEGINWQQSLSRVARLSADWRPPDFSSYHASFGNVLLSANVSGERRGPPRPSQPNG